MNFLKKIFGGGDKKTKEMKNENPGGAQEDKKKEHDDKHGNGNENPNVCEYC